MKKTILNDLTHIFIKHAIVLNLTFGLIVLMNSCITYNINKIGYTIHNDGPYVFYENDSTLSVNYPKGSGRKGFYVDQTMHSTEAVIPVSCFFPLDSSTFNFKLENKFEIPASIYDDGEPIIAISDIESAYQTFRDFLIHSNVVDDDLNWTFGHGHLVLVGDFVDRGNSTTQVLWFIYKLEQMAKVQGGHVHFIIGNHELKNFQGKYRSASPKYYGISTILGHQPHDLYSRDAFIGRWMTSKNTIERINGVLFTHGGIHPDFGDYDITLDQINAINRANYYLPYYPKPEYTVDQLVLSTKKGVCWYRGYFKGNLTQAEVEKGLNKFEGKAVVVGHTLKWKVKSLYEGKVIAIDVKHPNDYSSTWPSKSSEGLRIEDGQFYRVFSNGEQKKLLFKKT